MTMTKYDLEDLILVELHKQQCFVRVSDKDVSRVLVDGTLDVGRLAEALWEQLPRPAP